MKPNYLLIMLFLLLSSCSNDEDEVTYPREVKIVKELPLLYGSNTDRDTIMIIQDAVVLNDLYPSFPVSVNFNKQTLILGSRGYGRGIYSLDHLIQELTEGHYVYTLTIEYDLTLPVGVFMFGVVINKIPNDSEISLVVNEINP